MTSIKSIQDQTAQQLQQFSQQGQQDNKADKKEGDKAGGGAEKLGGQGEGASEGAAKGAAEQQLMGKAVGQVFDMAAKETGEAGEQLDATAKAFTDQLSKATSESVQKELHGTSQAEDGPKNSRAATTSANNDYNL